MTIDRTAVRLPIEGRSLVGFFSPSCSTCRVQLIPCVVVAGPDDDTATAYQLAWSASGLRLVGYLGITVLTGLLPVASVWFLKRLLDHLVLGGGGVPWSGIGLVALGLVLRRRFISVQVVGTSMEPTLSAGDRILVRPCVRCGRTSYRLGSWCCSVTTMLPATTRG